MHDLMGKSFIVISSSSFAKEPVGVLILPFCINRCTSRSAIVSVKLEAKVYQLLFPIPSFYSIGHARTEEKKSTAIQGVT